ncbi:hypothetical protein TNIN_47731 [Trichonephila inaurata madagascariensis]|uniref:SHSP domain-containing protein n=1 Tax=Trichonephila inaurata madagascariensis TaxID=2747483 RepID=A0A8X6YAE2_9ARAC|nr:hypothetical protein TNIN_289091 [Trichonephila inaurata madagascariensis]GFY69916.1 hypothetical protein TNIN_47731 [Trichonephila inaurata madagascariensis]
MEYEIREVDYTGREAEDWWKAIKFHPKKLIDQDFGYQLSRDDLECDPKGEILKRKSSKVENSGYLMVSFEKECFQVEFKGKDFPMNSLDASIEDGFVIIKGIHEERIEGTGSATRKFERHVMIPNEYNFGYIANEPKIDKSNGYICVTLSKARRRGQRMAFGE